MTSKWILAAAVAACGSAIGIPAQAQGINLSGQFQCVQVCRGPGPVFVTQNRWDLNLVNEVGQPSRAWIDYRGHIWAQSWDMGAVYSPDGMTIQFDNGAVWQRVVLVPVLPPLPPPPVLRSRG
jgi:hypothetical protein